MIVSFKESFGDKSVVGVEIGVFQGAHAEFILRTLNVKRLYLVDPFDSNDPDFAGRCKPLIDASEAVAEKRLAPYADKLVWLRVRSDDAVDKIEEELDFVYIDGNHGYDFVMRDIKNYFRLVRPGGWIGGHDYMMRRSPPIEVKRAVDDFISETGYKLCTDSGKFPDWWVCKT